ncbi:MAG TPA: hypothetical protein VIL48_16440 [Acidimicrobiales bacterium]
MGKPDELTAKERRQFEDLIRTYFEFEAYDPHAGGPAPAASDPESSLPPLPALSPLRRARWPWLRWRRWRRRPAGPAGRPG